ncbi:MAG: hypothetical protein ACTS8S_06380 [Giesbergeria sp.]
MASLLAAGGAALAPAKELGMGMRHSGMVVRACEWQKPKANIATAQNHQAPAAMNAGVLVRALHKTAFAPKIVGTEFCHDHDLED